MIMSATNQPAIWKWALWFGCLAGLAEAVLIAVARATTNRLIFTTSDAVWMAPLIDAAVLAVVALVVQVAVQRLHASQGIRLALTVFLFLFLIGPLLIVPRLHAYAALIIAAGAAVEIGRLLRARTDRFDGVVRHTLPALACLVAALGLGLHLARHLGERRVLAATTPADPTAPNVLLIVLDTVRAQSLGLYGYSRRTSPHLDTFAETGVTFERALSTSPWTLPSHASLFSGRFPHELSADWLTPLDARHPTLAGVFAARGYATAGFVGNLLYCPRETGLARGFMRYHDYPVSLATIIGSSWLTRALAVPERGRSADSDRFLRKDGADVSEEFLAWLGARPSRPFFAFLNYFDTHAPYVPPAPFDTMFGDGGPQPDPFVRRSWSKTQIQRSLDAYDGAVAYVDDEIGRLIDALNARQLLENTLIVITSDHGEQFGEHGLFDHANSLYRQVLHVPLIISSPHRIPASVRVADPVSLVDLAATILDVAGIGDGIGPLPGRSLAKYWREPNGHRESTRPLLAEVSKGINTPPWLPVSKGPMKSVIDGGFHYIRHSDGHEELYDFERDTAELDNLADRTDARPALERSRRALDSIGRSSRADAAAPGRAWHF